MDSPEFPTTFVKRKKVFSSLKRKICCDVHYFGFLHDDIIFGIFFSGYLGYSYRQLYSYLLICKHFQEIGSKRIGLLEIFENFDEKNLLSLCSTMQLSSIVYLKINYNNTEFTPATISSILLWKQSLKGISFRGSMINDQDLVQLLTEFSSSSSSSSSSYLSDIINSQSDATIPNLVSLDLSKDSRSNSSLISDTAIISLIAYKEMKWLSLSVTGITDYSISLICSNMKKLYYLNIAGCYKITDDAFEYIKTTSLKYLNISNCRTLTSKSLQIMFKNEK
jgi:hypothetical protein